MKSCVSQTVAILRDKLANSIGLPFAQLLPESSLEKILTEERVSYRKRRFCPIITLWAWLSQVLDPDKSCKNACTINRPIGDFAESRCVTIALYQMLYQIPLIFRRQRNGFHSTLRTDSTDLTTRKEYKADPSRDKYLDSDAVPLSQAFPGQQWTD